jgi:hypothetical protein
MWKTLSGAEGVTSAAKAGRKQRTYRSGEPLRHPKSSATSKIKRATQDQAQHRVFPQRVKPRPFKTSQDLS